ncbi:host cell division inhibitor Icd-like protein [Shewanella sp. BC20]|uniref:host cell division inhibitor Icd-like protein n=1 Tax=Shewanella sp. BC20 TaxID=2004459 RepID=UPI0015E823B6|nr:host cell division inhibitor Icd-like protein [Shewanella sp. BC20]
MLYTFLIAYRDQKLAQLARIRTVSTIANTEQAARNQLNGMPLVFVCRTPAKGGAL